jgi:hypothetical protein
MMSRRWLPGVVSALLVGGLVGGAFVAGLVGGEGPQDTENEARSAEGSGGPRNPVALEVFLDRWEAALGGTYVVQGTVTRSRGTSDGPLEQILPFRHARAEGRVLDQMGDLATVVADGWTRDCQLFEGGEVACGSAEPALTARDERMAMAETMSGDYVVFETEDDDCLEIIGTGPVTIGRWGQSSIVCFDRSTGAVVRVLTFTGSSATVLAAERVEAAPRPGDLEPGDPEPGK